MPGLQYAFAAPAVPSGWVAVYDESTFNAAVASGPLKTYYEQYPTEDLWHETDDRLCTAGDQINTSKIYSNVDATGDPEYA
jgi:hypothetical protein